MVKKEKIQFKDIQNRLFSSFCVGVVFIGSLVSGQGAWLYLCLLLASLLAYEWLNMVIPNESKPNLYSLLLLNTTVIFFSGAGLLFSISIDIFIGLGLLSLSFLYQHYKIQVPFQRKTILWIIGGLFYTSLPCWILIHLRAQPQGLYLCLWLFSVIWASDISAYFTGQTLQGKRLAPKVSPNKTWSGFMGGLIAALLVSILWLFFIEKGQWLYLLSLTITTSIIGQMGDLFQSYLKRYWNIKDMGTILPGHGGAFDRFDSLLPALIFIQILLWVSGVPLLWR